MTRRSNSSFALLSGFKVFATPALGETEHIQVVEVEVPVVTGPAHPVFRLPWLLWKAQERAEENR
jgi:hypothetical protein